MVGELDANAISAARNRSISRIAFKNIFSLRAHKKDRRRAFKALNLFRLHANFCAR